MFGALREKSVLPVSTISDNNKKKSSHVMLKVPCNVHSIYIYIFGYRYSSFIQIVTK